MNDPRRGAAYLPAIKTGLLLVRARSRP
jgi:hypothetical protein